MNRVKRINNIARINFRDNLVDVKTVDDDVLKCEVTIKENNAAEINNFNEDTKELINKEVKTKINIINF